MLRIISGKSGEYELMCRMCKMEKFDALVLHADASPALEIVEGISTYVMGRDSHLIPEALVAVAEATGARKIAVYANVPYRTADEMEKAREIVRDVLRTVEEKNLDVMLSVQSEDESPYILDAETFFSR